MGIVRKWIFPIFRLLIFTAIAVALVKVAFFPDVSGETNPDVPSAQITEPQIPVALGTIQNDVTLSGVVSADEAVPIKATLAGEVRKLLVTPGQHVDPGTPILTIRAEVPSADGLSVAVKTITVTSPTAGTLSSFPTLVGQVFSVGEDVGKVAPATFHVSGPLAPEQLYRLSARPTEALVTISGGPAPFTCTALTITTLLAGGDTGESSGGPTVSCAIPLETTVFSGLTARIVISGGAAENVLIVPITAVEGLSESGNVYFVLPDGSTELRPVTLGLNDGHNVEVKGGLAEGDLVLEFIPGAPAVDPSQAGCATDENDNTICMGG